MSVGAFHYVVVPEPKHPANPPVGIYVRLTDLVDEFRRCADEDVLAGDPDLTASVLYGIAEHYERFFLDAAATGAKRWDLQVAAVPT